MSKNQKRSKWFILLYIVIGIALIYGALFLCNVLANISLRNYIKTLKPVDYSTVSDHVLPVMDKKTGYYTFTTDRDLKVLHVTDIHIGGGIFTLKKDKKALKEVATMLQAEKPDLVITTGDNTFAVPALAFHGGGTFNNGMVAKTLMKFFEQEAVYYTTTFGNHDTESFDYTSRQRLAEMYMSDKNKHCILHQDFTDTDAKIPSVTNQIILIKNKKGDISKALLLLDSNSYASNNPLDSLNWNYDVLHDAQIKWAAKALKDLGNPQVLEFQHIPTGEFQEAYLQLEANQFKDTKTVQYISGVWGEEYSEKCKSRILYGGVQMNPASPAEKDQLFETLGPDGTNTLEAIFCGHDHTNNAVVRYKGVLLSYNYAEDNIAYPGLDKSGTQRGATLITISPDGTWNEIHKNAYIDYQVSSDEFVDIYLDHPYKGDAVLPGTDVARYDAGHLKASNTTER